MELQPHYLSSILDRIEQLDIERDTEQHIGEMGAERYTALISSIELFSFHFSQLLEKDLPSLSERLHLNQGQKDTLEFVLSQLSIPDHSERILDTVQPFPTSFFRERGRKKGQKNNFRMLIAGFTVDPSIVHAHHLSRQFPSGTQQLSFIEADGTQVKPSQLALPLLHNYKAEDSFSFQVSWNAQSDRPFKVVLYSQQDNLTFDFMKKGDIFKETILDEGSIINETLSDENTVVVDRQLHPSLPLNIRTHYINCGVLRIDRDVYTVFAINHSWIEYETD